MHDTDTQLDRRSPGTDSGEGAAVRPRRRDTETEGDDVGSPEARARRSAALAIAAVGVGVFAVAGAVLIVAFRSGGATGPNSAPSAELLSRIDALERRPSAPTDGGAAEKLAEQIDRLDRRLDRIDKRLAALESRPATTVEKAKSAPPAKTNGATTEPKVAKVEPPTKTKSGAVEPPTASDGPAARLSAALGPGDPLEAVRDLAAAMAAFRELDAQSAGNPLPAEACVLMARAAFAADRNDDALKWAVRAAGTLPGSRTADRIAAHKLEAAAAYRLGRYDVAEAAVGRVAMIDPTPWPAGSSIRVRSLIALKRLPAAEAAAREAITALERAGGKTGPAHLNLAWVYLATAEAAKASLDEVAVTRAAEGARAALESAKSESAGREWPVAMGLTLWAEGKAAEAAASLRFAVPRRNESPALQYWLGLAAAAASDTELAASALARAGELARKTPNDDTREPLPVVPSDWPADPRLQSSHAGCRLGSIYLSAGKYGEAERHFRAAYLVRGDFAAAYEGACEALLKLGRPADALEVIGEAVELAPKSARAHLLRAVASVDTAGARRRPVDVDAVAGMLVKALELDPGTRSEFAAFPSLAPVLKDKRLVEGGGR